MALTRSKGTSIFTPEGNSLAVFIDVDDGNIKLKDVYGSIEPLTTVLNLKELIVDKLGFNTSYVYSTLNEGEMAWNPTDGTLDLRMGRGGATQQIGQETFYPPVVNKDSIDLINGTLVMVDPNDIAQGNRIRVIRSQSDGTYPVEIMVGILTESIERNQEGFATWFGYVRDLSLPDLQPLGETWVEGDILYPNPSVLGGLTKNKPIEPNWDNTICVVTAINGVNLTLLVRPILWTSTQPDLLITDTLNLGANPSATTQSTAVINAFDTNSSIAIVPNGTGALTLQVPDGTPTGGDARGDYSIDLQRIRANSNEVVTSKYSAILSGANNKVRYSFSSSFGWYNVISGGIGNTIDGRQDAGSQGKNFIGAGVSNSINVRGGGDVIVGGNTNSIFYGANGNANFIGGGTVNSISGDSSGSYQGRANVLVGGCSNALIGEYSVLGGGCANTICCSNFSTISGGRLNVTSTGDNTTIIGGASNLSSGQYAISGGFSNIASGLGSVALGYDNTSSGTNSIAIGCCNSATLNNTISIGCGNTNNNRASTTLIGLNNRADQNNAIAIGVGNVANYWATAIGNGAFACGQHSISISAYGGTCNIANSSGTIVGGRDNRTSGAWSGVFAGYSNSASGSYSVAMGTCASAYLYGQASFSSGRIGNGANPQYSYLMAKNELFTNYLSGASSQLYLDGSSALIIPSGNRSWSVVVETLGTVQLISGTATGVSVGDTFMQKDTILLNKYSGVSTIIGTSSQEFISSTSMSTASMTYSIGASQDLALTFNAPTFSGGGTLYVRVVSKISLVEMSY